MVVIFQIRTITEKEFQMERFVKFFCLISGFVDLYTQTPKCRVCLDVIDE